MNTKYLSPEFEVLLLNAEAGFATSGISTQQLDDFTIVEEEW